MMGLLWVARKKNHVALSQHLKESQHTRSDKVILFIDQRALLVVS